MTATATRTRTRKHDRDALNTKWDRIWHELQAESAAADKRRDKTNASAFQIRRFAKCLKKLFEATGRMPMLAHRLCHDPDTFAYYERGLEAIRRSLGHINQERMVRDRPYAKLKTAALRRIKARIKSFCPQVCEMGDTLQWISIVID